MKTISYIIAILTAALVPATVSANDQEERLKEAFECIIKAAQFTSLNEVHNYFSDPKTGEREGKLDLIVYTLPPEGMYLIDAAREVYEQINRNGSDSDQTLNSNLYTLWMNTANKGNDYSGYRLYYSPDQTILVGNEGGNCYTVGFISPDDKKHRTTYTLEWDNNGSSIKGRIITTYAPIKAKSKSGNLSYSLEIDSLGVKLNGINIDSDKFSSAIEKYHKGMEKYQTAMDLLSGEFPEHLDQSFSFSSSSSNSGESNAKSWMKKMLFYVNKVQEKGDRYLYLSKLYELCKDTEGLDQTDLKIAMQQLALIYKQLKAKNKLKENELLFLENMVDLLESKITK